MCKTVVAGAFAWCLHFQHRDASPQMLGYFFSFLLSSPDLLAVPRSSELLRMLLEMQRSTGKGQAYKELQVAAPDTQAILLGCTQRLSKAWPASSDLPSLLLYSSHPGLSSVKKKHVKLSLSQGVFLLLPLPLVPSC